MHTPSRSRSAGLTLFIVVTLSSALAAAQDPPSFTYVKPEDIKAQPATEKKLQAKGGLLLVTGNSRATTGTLGAVGSYAEGWNRFSAEANAAYARSSIVTINDANGDKMVEPNEVTRLSQATSKLLAGKGRYDRFLTLNNSGYVSVQALTDKLAGKELVAGTQVGYSRQLVKDEHNLAVAELGYDYSYELAATTGADAVSVHSVRAFLSEQLKLNDTSGAFLSLEVLSNLNKETAPAPGFSEPKAFHDTRFNGKAGVTMNLWKNIALAFSFTLRYDQAPAPFKAPGSDLTPSANFRAEKVDTLTEANVVVTFL